MMQQKVKTWFWLRCHFYEKERKSLQCHIICSDCLNSAFMRAQSIHFGETTQVTHMPIVATVTCIVNVYFCIYVPLYLSCIYLFFVFALLSSVWLCVVWIAGHIFWTQCQAWNHYGSEFICFWAKWNAHCNSSWGKQHKKHLVSVFETNSPDNSNISVHWKNCVITFKGESSCLDVIQSPLFIHLDSTTSWLKQTSYHIITVDGAPSVPNKSIKLLCLEVRSDVE